LERLGHKLTDAEVDYECHQQSESRVILSV